MIYIIINFRHATAKGVSWRKCGFDDRGWFWSRRVQGSVAASFRQCWSAISWNEDVCSWVSLERSEKLLPWETFA